MRRPGTMREHDAIMGRARAALADIGPLVLGAQRLPITVRPGSPAVAGSVLTGAAGEFILDADRL